jgi:hypothetical protein
MSTNRLAFTSRVAAPLRTIGALVRDAFVTAEASDFCCGVRFERTRPKDEMPTPSSCCGVRF